MFALADEHGALNLLWHRRRTLYLAGLFLQLIHQLLASVANNRILVLSAAIIGLAFAFHAASVLFGNSRGSRSVLSYNLSLFV